MKRLSCAVAAGLLLLTSVGCGNGKAKVEGHIARSDGTPLVNAQVSLSDADYPDAKQSARGRTDANGKFRLGTQKSGDGVPPGKFKVVIVEDIGSFEAPTPLTIHPKYQRAATTDLTVEVAVGELANLEFKLDPPQ